MRLPSISTLVSGAGAALRRFPFAIASGMAAAVGAVWLIEWTELKRQELTIPSNLFLVGMLGISLFIGIEVFAEHRGWPLRRRTLLALAGAAALGIYFFMLPANVFLAYEHYLVTYALLIVAAHFAVAMAPYDGAASLQRFWDFNKSMFLRFLAAGLYSGVLFAGLSIALLALDKLLGVTIEERMYGQLFAAIGLGFNTWFFVSTVPPAPSPKDEPYPRALKTFSQYTLIPLVTIYVLILYAYSIKILAVWEWPEGWVANLVLGFSVTGILALLFVYPIREREENRWIRTIWRWYFPALFPLTLLLLLAIWRRVSEYGITPNRYIVIGMGLWLFGLVVYFSLRRSSNIAIIPLTFLALTLAATFGPWGAVSVSERSQRARLEELLVRHNILQNGSIVRAQGLIASDEAAEISSVVQYLCTMHGPGVLRPWFGDRLDPLVADSSGDLQRARGTTAASKIVAAMGVPFSTHWGKKSGWFFFRSASGRVTSITGYDRLYAPGRLGRWQRTNRDSSGTFGVRLDPDRGMLTLELLKGSFVADSAVFSLGAWLDSTLASSPVSPDNMPAAMMIVEGSGASMDVRVLLQQFEGRRVGDSTVVDSIIPEFLVRTGPDSVSGLP
jgi:hypothetical protein